jgi:sigma-B regulation protein RsbQ
MMFAHGFGCDQNMWRYVWPQFADAHRIILFDHAGMGAATPDSYDRARHASLRGYADDVVEICAELELRDVIFVGHSVSAMIGVLAAIDAPDRFASLVLLGPSPRYLNDDAYVGGFTREDIDELLDSLSSNYLGWSSQMAPLIMGNPEQPELGEELTNSFCRTDPEVAERFARVTFLSDNRADLERLPVPCLVLQCSDDVLAPASVGQYVHERLPESQLVFMEATGHCPNLSAPEETTAAIREFLSR